MPKLGHIVHEIRSKNAGPFSLTIDIFCNSREIFEHVRSELTSQVIANIFCTNSVDVRRFEISNLDVIKFSLPRPQVQGNHLDRDMHAAQFAVLLSEFEIRAMS